MGLSGKHVGFRRRRRNHPTFWFDRRISSTKPNYGLRLLLIAEAVLLAAIRALPGDAVAGHAPQIDVHARLADMKAAAAAPAKRGDAAAAVTRLINRPTALAAAGTIGRPFHRLSFILLHVGLGSKRANSNRLGLSGNHVGFRRRRRTNPRF